MSHKDYQQSKQISLQDPPFYAMVIAAAAAAPDNVEQDRVRVNFPQAWRRPHDVEVARYLAQEFEGLSFASWIMALMRQADTKNSEVIKREWPILYAEMKARYNSPGGILRGETV